MKTDRQGQRCKQTKKRKVHLGESRFFVCSPPGKDRRARRAARSCLADGCEELALVVIRNRNPAGA